METLNVVEKRELERLITLAEKLLDPIMNLNSRD